MKGPAIAQARVDCTDGGLDELVEYCARAAVRRSGQRRPPYCPRLLVKALSVTAVVIGAELPERVDEIVSMTAEGPMILYRRELGAIDRRFAIAHAAGHLALGDFATQAPLRPGLLVPRELRAARDRERRCDRFAAAALVPLDDLAREMAALGGAATGDRETQHQDWLDRLDRLGEIFMVPPNTIRRRIGELSVFHVKQTDSP